MFADPQISFGFSTVSTQSKLLETVMVSDWLKSLGNYTSLVTVIVTVWPEASSESTMKSF